MYFESEKINLNNIKFFIVAAESKSLSEAAEKIDYSVSNVSTNLSTLESQLGVKLLERDPLKPTEIGKKIYDTFKNAYNEIEFASKLAKDSNNINSGKIKLGCPLQITKYFLMEKIEKAIKENNNLKIELDSESTPQKYFKKIRDNRLDFTLLNFIPTDEDLKEFEIKEIFSNEYIFVSNREILVKDIKELNNFNFIISYEYRSSALQLTRQLEEYGVKINTALRCSSIDARIDAAKRGIGIAYVVKDSVTEELESKELHEVKLPIELPKNHVNLVYLKDRLTEVDKKFIKDYMEIEL